MGAAVLFAEVYVYPTCSSVARWGMDLTESFAFTHTHIHFFFAPHTLSHPTPHRRFALSSKVMILTLLRY